MPILWRLAGILYAESYTASRVSNTASEPKAVSERRLSPIFQTRLDRQQRKYDITRTAGLKDRTRKKLMAAGASETHLGDWNSSAW